MAKRIKQEVVDGCVREEQEEYLSGNKGEWSEPYVLLKILGDGKLHIADKDLQKMSVFYPIVKVLRQEEEKLQYILSEDNSIVKIITETEELDPIPVKDFQKNAEIIYNAIERETATTFEVEEVSHFFEKLKIKRLKAKSQSKADITLVVHDLKTNLDSEVSFSIKSRLGKASTLLNPSKDGTNFVFKIKTSKKLNVEEINSIEGKAKIQNRVKKILDTGGRFSFIGMTNEIFEGNLILIDSKFPELIAYMTYLYYSDNGSEINVLAEKAKERDICNQGKYENAYYEHNVKDFLTSIALGMVPGTKWSGKIDATGGYIIVREDGEVLCYHIYNRNEFQEYLFNNTKLDTPSTSRHDFGKIYEINDEYFMKLNLQIRFEK